MLARWGGAAYVKAYMRVVAAEVGRGAWRRASAVRRVPLRVRMCVWAPCACHAVCACDPSACCYALADLRNSKKGRLLGFCARCLAIAGSATPLEIDVRVLRYLANRLRGVLRDSPRGR